MNSVLLISVLIGLNADAFTLASTSNSNFKGWSKSEIQFQFNPANCPAGVDVTGIIGSALAVWNNVATSKVKVTYVGETTSTTYSDPITIVCDTNYAGGDAAMQDASPGVAQSLPGTGDYITSGLMSLNASAGLANIGNLSSTFVAITLAHEIGHLIGLGHSQDVNALMYYDIGAKTNLSLAQDDVDAITYLYPRDELSGDKMLGCGTVSTPPASGGNLLAVLIAMLLPLMTSIHLRRQNALTKCN